MRKIWMNTVFAVSALSTATVANAQSTPLCALASPVHNLQTDTNPPPFAWQSMAGVNTVLCARFTCPGYQFWSNPNSGNAMATFSPQLGFAIRYNPAFMNQVQGSFGSGATDAILAHELGHVIDFANRPQAGISQADREATADQYAGCAFALAGLNRENLLPMARTLHAMGPSPGYPTPQQRVGLVLNGYDSCL
jgi:hypothetical protein